MKKKNLLIVFGRLKQAKQLFSSVYWNAGWKGDYMFLTPYSEIPEKELKWFKDKGILVKKCKPIPNSERLKRGKWPPLIFDRFYVFKPEFKKWRTIILMEEDLIVRASLNELTKIKGFAVVKGYSRLSKLFLERILAKLENTDKKIYDKLRRVYDLNEPSFNIGVMAFNTSVIKKDTFSKLKQLLNEYIEISAAGDESIFNLYFYKKWEELHSIYNIDPYPLIYLKKIKKEEVNGIILHFRKNKPWNYNNYFHKEWKNNLEKAELIDLKKIPPAHKIWTKQQIEKYESYLKNKHSNFNDIIWKTSVFIDESIGIFGLFIKKHSPRLYFKLKKLKDKI